MLIFYVDDQAEARRFYRALLGREPLLDVPGMTEFACPGGLTLGLMPEAGIRRLLPALAAAAPRGAGPARAELYLAVADPAAWVERALAAGAAPLDSVRPRDWGDVAGYVLDPWGHVLAFAAASPPGAP